MVNMQTQLSSGGTVLVRESVLRGSGPRGPMGPTGPQGTSMIVKGVVDTYDDLAAMANTPQLEHNNGWVVQDTGLLYVWYRTNPDSAGLYTGSWVIAGRIRGNPGYLNSVAARCAETASDVDTDLLPGVPVVLRWDITYLDVEVVPVIEASTGLLVNENRPIVSGLKTWDGTNSVSTIAIDRIIPTVPPGNLSMDYPMGSAVFLVNVAVDFHPTSALTPRGVATVRLFWWSDASNRTEVAAQQTYVTDKEATLNLTTFIRGADGGQYEVEVTSNVAGLIETRRWEWMRVGGGPGPQGDQGLPGAPARIHPDSPLANTNQLQTTIGSPGEYILCDDTGIMHAWQESSVTPGEYGWAELGVIRGPNGNYNDGFSDWDAVSGDPDGASGTEEIGYPPLVTVDQNAPYPDTNSMPRVPFYIRKLAEWVETRIVSRFASAVARASARPSPDPGELSWVGDGTQVDRGLDVATGDNGYMRVPLVVYGTTDAPSGTTTYPDGTLWVKY